MKKVLVLSSQPQEICEAVVGKILPDLEHDEILVFKSMFHLTEEVKRDNHLYVHCVVEKGREINTRACEILLKNNPQIIISRHVKFEPD